MAGVIAIPPQSMSLPILHKKYIGIGIFCNILYDQLNPFATFEQKYSTTELIAAAAAMAYQRLRMRPIPNPTAALDRTALLLHTMQKLRVSGH